MSGEIHHQPQVHQVLATLAYGDAIGNEAIGIRAALTNAGYESRIYVQTADPQVEDLTEDYRELIQDSDPDNILIHHFSIASRASRLASGDRGVRRAGESSDVTHRGVHRLQCARDRSMC